MGLFKHTFSHYSEFSHLTHSASSVWRLFITPFGNLVTNGIIWDYFASSASSSSSASLSSSAIKASQPVQSGDPMYHTFLETLYATIQKTVQSVQPVQPSQSGDHMYYTFLETL